VDLQRVAPAIFRRVAATTPSQDVVGTFLRIRSWSAAADAADFIVRARAL